MELSPELEKVYTKEKISALAAQRKAQEIAFAPVVFQISRLMLEFGVLDYISEKRTGATTEEIAAHCDLSQYAAKVLLDASLSIGTVLVTENGFVLSKTGWFLLNDKTVRANLAFNHDVNYLGLFHLGEALKEGKPAGLKVFGEWSTIYEALSSLPDKVRQSWFGFDHLYSDESFTRALELVFNPSRKVRTLLDVGGNTGRWATKCVEHDPDVQVTILDLPQQIGMMKENTAETKGADRIHGYPCNLLDGTAVFPDKVFDAIWMSQFLDCFSEAEIKSICSRALKSMDSESRLYVMETFWDRQRFETAAYCLTLTSPYFTAMANGNSKMYHSGDMIRCLKEAGLEIESITDGIGLGHSIVTCRKA